MILGYITSILYVLLFFVGIYKYYDSQMMDSKKILFIGEASVFYSLTLFILYASIQLTHGEEQIVNDIHLTIMFGLLHFSLLFTSYFISICFKKFITANKLWYLGEMQINYFMWLIISIVYLSMIITFFLNY